MNRKYIDFIHEAIENPELAKELKAQSFDTVDDVRKWFAGKEVVLDDREAESLFNNQENMKKGESPNY